MSTMQIKKVTPDELLAMPDSSSIELVDGELVEKPVSVLSSLVEARTLSKLVNYCDAHKTAIALSSTNGIRCFPDDPDRVRKPNVSVVRRERFLPKHLVEGFLSIAPDLAVEVVSTHDEVAELHEKIEEYLAAGVSLVWVIDPETKIVIIHRKDGSVTKLHMQDDLSGENVLPGFVCKVAELFPES